MVDGADILTGGAGADIITGGDAADTIVGNAGADSITGGAGDDIITGGDGNDIITIDSGEDKVKDLGGSSGSDDDVVVVNAGATLNAIDIIGFTATAATKNNSTNANNAKLTAKDGAGRTIDVSLATEVLKPLKFLVEMVQIF